mmetsp:Transcript_7932/g.11788  ORF Transcript_7932/g.11788 Transcript_7932/m.11788 type:complete len:132 (-) Transcript_7932:43-438(-)
MLQYGPDWLYIAMIFNFVIQLTFIVMEKEKNLRAAMAQMGLRRTAYWVSWFISCEIINLIVVLLLCGFGVAIQLEFFHFHPNFTHTPFPLAPPSDTSTMWCLTLSPSSSSPRRTGASPSPPQARSRWRTPL